MADGSTDSVLFVLEAVTAVLASARDETDDELTSTIAFAVTSAVASGFGGSALLWLLDDNSEPVLAAGADAVAATRTLLVRALGRTRGPGRRGLLGHVLSTAAPLEVAKASWSQLEDWDEREELAELEALGPVAMCIVPVRARARLRGALLLARPAGRGLPNALERSLLQDVADRLGLAGAYAVEQDARDGAEIRLRANAARQAALAELGRWALVGLAYPNLLEDAVSMLAVQLEVDFVHVFEVTADGAFMTMTASRGHGVASPELLSTDPTSSPVSFALVTQETVVCDDLAREARFDIPELWTRTEAMSVVEAPIPGQDSPIGVLGVGCRSPRSFDEEDVSFVVGVANVLAAAAARSRAESAIRHQALSDPLTGLPNRLVLADHGHSVAVSARSEMTGSERTVLVLDIDRFKEVNDTLGYALGDLVLVEVARRLHELGEPVEIVARLGADEFAVVAERPQDELRMPTC